jgi:hypothetical protein
MQENTNIPESVEGFTVEAIIDANRAVAEQSYQNAVDAGARIAGLEQQVKNLIEDRDNWIKWCTRADETISTAKEQIEQAIANGDISEDELTEPFWTQLFATLGVESHEVVEIDVVATWTVSVTKPRGRKLHETDFTAELQIESSELDFDGWVRSPEIDISEN